jgi:hypothetical protein
MKPDNCATLNVRAFGVAAGTVAAALSAICGLALMIWPASTMGLISNLFHSDLSGVRITVTWTTLVTGAVGWALLTGLVFSTAARLYNRFTGETSAEHHHAAGHRAA